MKKYFAIALAALALMACNKTESPKAVSPGETSLQPVLFDSYLFRGVGTRSGYAGELDATALQTQGFGVFAYYTDINAYDDQSMPNFMYNQEVTYDDSNWTYEPVKYWPNEYGAAAISDDVDKVSFFAYAPYVEVTPSTGKVEDATYGITGMNRNTANGDPIVKYIGSFDPTKSVDLCWGVAHGPDASAWNIVQTGGVQTPAIVAGKPWIDVQRPKDPANQKLKFTFNHALSQLNVQIDADFDIYEHADDETVPHASDAATKIYVRSIAFTGFAMKGALNLNNTALNSDDTAKAEWLDYAGINDITSGDEYVIYDGRKDGREGVTGAIASNEKTLGLNPVIIQGDAATAGVTNAFVNLFNSATADTPIYVIPVDNEITVTINYDVETVDENLPTLLSDGEHYGSSINNVITKTITFGEYTKFQNGYSYVIKLHLGMNSVKFDADIVGWTAVSDESDTYLPKNGPTA